MEGGACVAAKLVWLVDGVNDGVLGGAASAVA